GRCGGVDVGAVGVGGLGRGRHLADDAVGGGHFGVGDDLRVGGLGLGAGVAAQEVELGRVGGVDRVLDDDHVGGTGGGAGDVAAQVPAVQVLAADLRAGGAGGHGQARDCPAGRAPGVTLRRTFPRGRARGKVASIGSVATYGSAPVPAGGASGMLASGRIFGDQVGSTAPVFLAFLAVHVLAGLTAVITGAIAAFSRKGSTRHIRVGRWYYRAIGAVFATAAALAAMRWQQ